MAKLDRVTVHPGTGEDAQTFSDPMELWSFLVDSHVRSNRGCHLDLHLESDALLDVKIECGRCAGSLDLSVPKWAFGAAVLAFHTDHEGHPFRVTCSDGFSFESAAFQQVGQTPRWRPLPKQQDKEPRLRTPGKTSGPRAKSRVHQAFLDARKKTSGG